MKLHDAASLYSTLADGTRLRLLCALSEGSLTVSELAACLNLSQPRVSHHLAILLRNRLVRVRREGVRAYYASESKGETASAASGALSLLEDDPSIHDDRMGAAALLAQRKALRREFFASLASTWPEDLAAWIDLNAYRSIVAEWVPQAAAVADLGCGSGWLLPVLARHATRIIGVDHAPELLARARQYASALSLEHCDFRLGELEHLPLKDRETAVVFFGLVLHHVPDPPAVLDEAARVCDTGGTLLLVEPLLHRNERARDELGGIWLGFSEEELRNWVESAGFAPQRIQTYLPPDGRLALIALRAERVNH